MTIPEPSSSRTLLGSMTQAVKTIHAKADFSKLILKRNARVPELQVHSTGETQVYPLISDRYIIGRSARTCDIVIRNPIISQVHASIQRDPRHRHRFVLRDEQSTNGIFRRKRRIQSQLLQHKDTFTLGPGELESAVSIEYRDPPPWYVRGMRFCLYGTGGVVAIALAAIALEWQNFTVKPLPASSQGPIVVLSRDQTPLAQRREAVHGELKKLSDFSPYISDALLASEDSRYYWHIGVDPIGIARAVVTNFTGGTLREGASTITQQLARSLFRSYVGSEDSLDRKFREAVVALKLETYYSKDLLLLLYLNKVYLGVYANGFEDAARFYFDKPAKDLNIAEAATLVGILPAPNAFNPVQDYNAALDYRNRVITRMAQQGRISQSEADRARRSRIDISPKARQQLQSIKAPYYYSYVFDELKELLGSSLAQEGNFIVTTSLDLATQEQAEQTLKNSIATSGPSINYSQGALVTMDYRAGEIIALVGGTDYQKSQFNRVTQALRQPGSTFKLFGYTAAVEANISPNKTYACAPFTWQGQTYTGCQNGGSGNINMFQGFALSENVVALRVAQDAGLNRVIQTAERLGITSKLQAVPALVLGQSEVTLLELSQAYAVVANRGLKNPPLAIRQVLDAGDCKDPRSIATCRVIYDRAQNQRQASQVLDQGVADVMIQMMEGVVRSGTGRAAALNVTAAGKTGTTNDARDLWFVGFVPSRSLLTGIWLGNDDNQPTSGSSAQAATVWGDYMRQIINQ
ncbi:MAG: PBP1A family penicillin-binding protein [Acaryochloridaceae cyanobacterium SU_2_1]|nr:PBP1A family penicillin-binding protein [Acaryochloridaceae cyanobacterium SU_2_1]